MVDLTTGSQSMLCQLSYYDEHISCMETTLPASLPFFLLEGCIRKNHFRWTLWSCSECSRVLPLYDIRLSASSFSTKLPPPFSNVIFKQTRNIHHNVQLLSFLVSNSDRFTDVPRSDINIIRNFSVISYSTFESTECLVIISISSFEQWRLFYST